MRIRPLRTLVVAALMSALCLPAARAAPAAWTVEPGAGRAYVYLEGVPGTVLEDRVSVTNPGAKPLTVRLRPADAYNTRSGALAVRGDRTSTGAGTWITLASETLTVPPRTRAEIPFSVTVPSGALPGDHPGAIMAASDGRESGVRIHLRVGGPTLAAFTVEDVRIFAGAIHYTLVNRGNTALTPRVAFRADGLFGQVLRRAPRKLPVELLPAQRVSLSEKWPDPPALDSVTVHIEATASRDATAEASASAAFVPWGTVTAAAAGLLAAGGTALWCVRRRRHPPDPGPRSEQPGGDRHLVRSGA